MKIKMEKIFPALCGKCEGVLEFRQTEIKEDEKNINSKILGWIIFGVCDDCKIVYVMHFSKGKKCPLLNKDYFIDTRKKCDK